MFELVGIVVVLLFGGMVKGIIGIGVLLIVMLIFS